jgi:hypothetical protein
MFSFCLSRSSASGPLWAACHLAAEIFQHAHDDVEDAGIVVNNQYSMAHRAHGPLTERINAPLFGKVPARCGRTRDV